MKRCFVVLAVVLVITLWISSAFAGGSNPNIVHCLHAKKITEDKLRAIGGLDRLCQGSATLCRDWVVDFNAYCERDSDGMLSRCENQYSHEKYVLTLPRENSDDYGRIAYAAYVVSYCEKAHPDISK